jgi:hypothetical protein
MEIIEEGKVVEKKDYASKGVGNAGLTLGIIGTALGAYALSGRNSGWNLFGGSSTMPENVNILASGLTGANGTNAPTAFQAWEQGCDNYLKATTQFYEGLLNEQEQRFNDRQTIDSQMFSLYKSQVDGDFGLYQNQRNGFDGLNKKLNESTFALYKSQRDNKDELLNRITALETKQAVADAVEPWRARVLDMQIGSVNAAAQNGIAIEAERRCCNDGKIVNYANSTFYPIAVANVTTGTTTTLRNLFNPLQSGCNCSCGSTVQPNI